MQKTNSMRVISIMSALILLGIAGMANVKGINSVRSF
jgi:hypothetical protein